MRVAVGQGKQSPEPLPITSARMAALWDGLVRVYGLLGFEAATSGMRGSGNATDGAFGGR